jgi:hypothetical protein
VNEIAQLWAADTSPGLVSQLTLAIPLALAAGFSPTTLAVLVYYLSGSQPLRPALAFLFGALAITVPVAVAGVVVLRSADIEPRDRRSPSAGVDIALGVALLVFALVLSRRAQRPVQAERTRQRTVRSAFALGLLLNLPSLFFLAALKHLSDADARILPTGLAVALIVALDLITVEVVIVLFLMAPDWTRRHLVLVNEWTKRHGRPALMWLAVLGGCYLIARGLVFGLT